MNAQQLTWALCQAPSPFDFHTQLLCVSNTNSFTAWEADLLVVSRAGYMTEVEVKVSLSDWRADAKKYKFKILSDQGQNPETAREQSSWRSIKAFWYAVPVELAPRYTEAGIPDWAGVMGVREPDEAHHWQASFEIVRQPKIFKAVKLTERRQLELARLGACRQWTGRSPFSEE